MMQRTVHLMDVGADNVGITRVVCKPEETFRRWRPALFKGNLSEQFLASYFSHPHPVGWAGHVIADNALITHDGLTIVGDRLLIGDSLMYPLGGVPIELHRDKLRPDNGHYSLDTPDEEEYIPGRSVNLASPGWQIFGHWLVDVVPRLFRALSIEADTYLLAGPLKDWQRDMIAALGVDLSKCKNIDLDRMSYRCQQVVLPTFDRYNSELRPDFMDAHRIIAASTAQTSVKNRRLFVSRTAGSSRELVNREQVERIVSSMGIEVVKPETLSFPDQVRLFASASLIVGECGSGLHNTIYSPINTKVVVLQDINNPNYLQAQMAMLCNHDIFFVLGEPRGDGSFFIRPSDLVEAVTCAG